MEIAPTVEQKMALSFLQTSSSIATPKQLAEYRNELVKAPNGELVLAHPRYGQLPIASRVNWMKDQLMVLSFLRHIKDPNPLDILIDAQAVDSAIMESSDYRALTQLEMQEAFRRGINGEYGEFFGITAASLTGFLRGYMKAEKWQAMKAICYAEEQKRIAEEREKENRLHYELRLRGFVNPWGKKEKKVVTPEESEAHRRLIEKQREEILKNNTNQ